MLKKILAVLLIIMLFSCKKLSKSINSDVVVIGAMKNVMWKGELEGIISLDTIKNKEGLYGLGPVSYLTGELLINDGRIYESRVLTDSTMIVKEASVVSAPFFVYSNVNQWSEHQLPDSIRVIKDLEKYITDITMEAKMPFAFKLKGSIMSADIHIQNLPKGTKVSSPTEAHQGQTNYKLKNDEVEIIGFFSTKHKGVFTHHDSFLHMHLITKNKMKMGHLDDVAFNKMVLYLPK